MLTASAQRVRAALLTAGVAAQVIELAVAARTSQQAADALGIAVGQIAKSLIFRAVSSGRAVLVIAAGDRRVGEARVAAAPSWPSTERHGWNLRLSRPVAAAGLRPLRQHPGLHRRPARGAPQAASQRI
ncbi:MAG: YbaK/EbsC family protein [Curvibacter sp.]